jgi:hypothetical protein
MARKDRKSGEAQRLRELLEAGDHRRARGEARATLADPVSSEAARADAAAVLASLAPDRGVVAAGVVGVAIAIALAAWTLVVG